MAGGCVGVGAVGLQVSAGVLLVVVGVPGIPAAWRILVSALELEVSHYIHFLSGT
jgi:hypothetical protein